MASYLEAYGEAEQRLARRRNTVKWTAIVLLALALLGWILYATFRNYSEERRVQTFVDKLKAKDYKAAYAMWGCTETHPCRDYSFQHFMDDWGPKSPFADAAAAQVGSGDTCGTGVVVPVDIKGAEPVPLWVERATRIIGFSPDPECRKKHWHFREFFRSLGARSS